MNISFRPTGRAWMTTCILAGLTFGACAAELPAAPAGLPAAAEATQPEGTPAADKAPAERVAPSGALRGSRLLSASALASRRGGTAQASEMQLSGMVANNRVSDASTGSNLVTHGAFTGAAGLPMVIQNSGNNVLIQNATIINLQLK